MSSWLAQGIDMLAGNPNQGKMNRTLSQGMNSKIGGLTDLSTQMQGLGTDSFNFNSGVNVNQRNMLNSVAQDATATGALQGQRMASMQGMGGSGLLGQATQNQAYQNMMGAGMKGLQSYMNQQKLGQGYLQNAGTMLSDAGALQSDLNVSKANSLSTNAANRGAFGRGLVGLGMNRWGQE